MTSSPPDISTLSLSSQQRLHDSYDYEGNNAPRQTYQFNTSPALPSPYSPLSSLGQSPLKNRPAIRAGLPSQWLENNPSDNRSLSPHNNSDFSSAGGSPPMNHLNPSQASPMSMPTVAPAQSSEDEIIPTAIVIKNIPFNVKRETLLGIIESLSIPTPYAFNYHLDQSGQFRGLAFANFRQAADADAVVVALNGFDVQGRKLRVEYKKVLQAGEKERIEREKAIRRMRSMQLEKEQQAQSQHNPINQLYDDYNTGFSSFSPSRSLSSFQLSPPGLPPMPTPTYSMSLNSAPVVASAPQPPSTPSASEKALNELDMNDPSTLEIYSRILLFKDDPMRDELAFSRTLTPKQRRVVHLIAQKLGVYHYSVGEGDERYAVVTRIDPNKQQAQSAQRAHTLTRAPSAYLSPTTAQQPFSANQALKVKKSMPDMKTLHSQAPRLHPRASNGNIREGYATIASPSRRISNNFQSLFSSNGSAFGNGIPPVPSLPSSIINNTGILNGSSGHETMNHVLRQPRGPGVGGFVRRGNGNATGETTTGATTPQTRGVLDATTYEALEV